MGLFGGVCGAAIGVVLRVWTNNYAKQRALARE